jgi:hypothetical protein
MLDNKPAHGAETCPLSAITLFWLLSSSFFLSPEKVSEKERGKRPGDSRERADFRAVSMFENRQETGAPSCPYGISTIMWVSASLVFFVCYSMLREGFLLSRLQS